jgi:hypothetical protein
LQLPHPAELAEYVPTRSSFGVAVPIESDPPTAITYGL